MIIEKNKNTLIRLRVENSKTVTKYRLVSLSPSGEVRNIENHDKILGVAQEDGIGGQEVYVAISGITKIDSRLPLIPGEDVFYYISSSNVFYDSESNCPYIVEYKKIGKALDSENIELEFEKDIPFIFLPINNKLYTSNTNINLDGKRFIAGNIEIRNSSTVTVRSNLINQNAILEVFGDLILEANCTLLLVKTVLIVRGNIRGSGIIRTPDGINGGNGGNGGDLSTIHGSAGGPGSTIFFEYNLIPANGLPGGGVGGYYSNSWGSSPSGNGFGGGGGHGNVTSFTPAQPGGSGIAPSGNGGPGGTFPNPGSPGGPLGGGGGGGVQTSSSPLPLPPSTSPPGIGGGGGGLFVPSVPPHISSQWVGIAPNTPSISLAPFKGSDGSASSTPPYFTSGGGGGAFPPSIVSSSGAGGIGGGASGGCHITVVCFKTIEPTITIRSGKGGYQGIPGVGGFTHNRYPSAPTGNIYLFYNPVASNINDVSGSPAITSGPSNHLVPAGPPGNLIKYSRNSIDYSSMLSDIGYFSKPIDSL